jgi:hypothetical protein
MSKRPFVPSFLQKLDDKLLRNKPGTWASRAHLVIYFTAVFALLLFMFCYFVFFDAKQYSNVGSWVVFVTLLVFVGFIFWLIYLLRFNVFKRYGNWFAVDGLRDFSLYFISIAAMVAVCFVPSAVETMRANQQFSNDEIVKDINELNINACKLEYAILPLEWRTDTCKLVEKKYAATESSSSTEVEAVPVDDTVLVSTVPESGEYVPNYTALDTTELRTKIQNADSLLKISDSLYVFYESSNYRFVSSYNADNYTAIKMLSSADIYNSILKNYKKPDRISLIKRMDELKTKYAVNGRYGYDNDYDNSPNASYDAKISRKYDLSRISNGIDNVVRKKYAWKEDWPMYLRVFYYVALLLTMLVFIFRHTTYKTFFLSVLTAILLTIISALMLALNHSNEETTLLSFMILYYVVFAILALSIFKINTRKGIQGIGLNLFMFMTPFIPLIFLALYRANQYYNANDYLPEDMERKALHFLIAEITGSVILLILIQPLFKKLYRKWYSAPEE